MKQQCHISLIYLNWVVYFGGLIYLVSIGNYPLALFWLVILPLGSWAYVRLFPAIAVYLGYGSVEDKRARDATYAPVKARVRLYVAAGCPFCPLVETRLVRLRRQMGFELEKIDVTYHPELVAKEGIRSVPVVEVAGQRLIGHATTDQLAALIGGSAEPS